MNERIAVIGLGYVGLPVALAFARRFANTVGYDIDAAKIRELRRGHDRNHAVGERVLTDTTLRLTSDVAELAGATFFVVAAPTPVDANHAPDLSFLLSASALVAGALRKGGVVVYESTVYPGVTEDLCAPLLARLSGLPRADFRVAYSPERINPGDADHTLERIVKVVAAEDEATLARVAAAYGAIVDAGIHRAPSIKIAEAAKVIENTQRDLNIALMNELAFIFERMGLRTADVLAVAETKWNFLKFRPGLVGGHCVGVDPYYLTVKAQELGYQPEVILAGRRINNDVGPFIARKVVKMLIAADIPLKSARVGILGLTFKEDCHDLRNSKVPDLLAELRTYGIEALIHDPLGDPRDAQEQYQLKLSSLTEYRDLDAVVLAVNHRAYAELGARTLVGLVRDGGVFGDVKSALSPAQMERGIQYFSL